MIRFEEIRALVSEQLNVPLKDVRLESSFVDLGADSMDLSYMLIDLEELSGVEIPDDEYHKMFTVQDVLDYLNDPRSVAS